MFLMVWVLGTIIPKKQPKALILRKVLTLVPGLQCDSVAYDSAIVACKVAQVEGAQ